MRLQSLSAVRAGITRLRDKGGASPESLFDLLNGYVTAARTIRIRPGSRIDQRLPAGTKGLAWFKGQHLVFATNALDSGSEDVEVVVIRHPNDPSIGVRDIHFAMPFLGYPYAVAEFEDGLVKHYWIEKGEEWQPNHVYLPGALIRPSAGNDVGMVYRLASNRDGLAPWTAGAERELADETVPTQDNGFKYEVIAAEGANPRSGTVEPQWPAETDAVVHEDADSAPSPSSTDPNAPQVPPSVEERYGRLRQGENNIQAL
ncbi:MAG: hypothetical protein IAE88_11635 [Rhodobacteraceae bacterium]|nr:hypothetical protein [Paracoccaceae bacterium]